MPARKQPQTQIVSNLAQVRVEKGMSQEELARSVGISLKSLVRLEKRQVPSPPLAWFVNCAIVLDVDLLDILEPDHLRFKQLALHAPAPSGKALTPAVRRP